jgi:hypothetical protein
MSVSGNPAWKADGGKRPDLRRFDEIVFREMVLTPNASCVYY